MIPFSNSHFAEMRLGIAYSYNSGDPASQYSTVTVNGTLISSKAGNFDDGAAANGALLTIRRDKDPFTPFQPASISSDHERYNLVPYITAGAITLRVDTLNPSNDDNNFLAVLDVAGVASVSNTTPEPATWALFAGGLGTLVYFKRRRQA